MIHCNAPWVGGSFLPDGKYAPCCAYGGTPYPSIEAMTADIGGQFLRGEIPSGCLNPCPPNSTSPAWRDRYNKFATDYQTHKIKFLDFRNNNLCNMKCRSCGPALSSMWASEAKIKNIHAHKPVSISDLDLSECETVYFAGGEPLLNPQHYEVLDQLVAQGIHPEIMYSTNLSVLGYRDRHVKYYWPRFRQIYVHASIDAVGPHAAVVRSGTHWPDIEQNLTWLRSQPNVRIRIATVISAVNIWFLDSLFAYFHWLDGSHGLRFEPVLANVDSIVGLTNIPYVFRGRLIDSLSRSQFAGHVTIQKAIDTLQQHNYNESRWYQFLSQQLILDNYRQETWFDLLPVRHEIYKGTMNVG